MTERIIEAGQTVAGTFPVGRSKAELSAWIMDFMLTIAMDRLPAEGKSEAEAREIAEHVLSMPSPFVSPTIDELSN